MTWLGSSALAVLWGRGDILSSISVMTRCLLDIWELLSGLLNILFVVKGEVKARDKNLKPGD